MHNKIYLYVLKLNPFRQGRVRGKTKIAHCTNIDVCIIRTKWDKTTRETCVTLPRSMFYALNNGRRVNAVAADSRQRFYLKNLVCCSKTPLNKTKSFNSSFCRTIDARQVPLSTHMISTVTRMIYNICCTYIWSKKLKAQVFSTFSLFWVFFNNNNIVIRVIHYYKA